MIDLNFLILVIFCKLLFQVSARVMMNRLRVQKHRKSNKCVLADLSSSLLQLKQKFVEEDQANRSLFRGNIVIFI